MTEEPRYCSRCAREIEPGDAYCAGCGNAVPRMVEPPKPEPFPVAGMPVTREDVERYRKEDELKDAKTQVMYGCAFLVAIGIFVLLYLTGYR